MIVNFNLQGQLILSEFLNSNLLFFFIKVGIINNKYNPYDKTNYK